MKLPTLTAITLATAVLAAAPALAANTGNDNGNTAPSAGSASAAAVPGTNMPVTVRAPGAKGASTANAQMANDTAAATPGMAKNTNPPGSRMADTTASTPAAATVTGTPGLDLTNNPIGMANVVPMTNRNRNVNANSERTLHQRNPVLADDGLPRAGKVIGSAVYNASDKKVGSVADILMGERGHPDRAVLNLSEGNKRVLVPFHDLVFGNTRISGDNRVILPNQTPISLAQLPPFNFNANNTGNNGIGLAANRVGMGPLAASNTMRAEGTAGLLPVVPAHPRVAPANAKANGSAMATDTTHVTPGGNPTDAQAGTATVATKNGNSRVATNTAVLPHQRNPVLADDALPRASKVIGSTVYNSQDQKLGSVDEILMGENGQPDRAVLSVKNANKKVLVPFKQLVFGNTKITSNNRVILPDQTDASLQHLPAFVFNRNNG